MSPKISDFFKFVLDVPPTVEINNAGYGACAVGAFMAGVHGMTRSAFMELYYVSDTKLMERTHEFAAKFSTFNPEFSNFIGTSEFKTYGQLQEYIQENNLLEKALEHESN